jgi:hypothetical protein
MLLLQLQQQPGLGRWQALEEHPEWILLAGLGRQRRQLLLQLLLQRR